MNIQKIAVAGSGTMGAGIAQVFATAGFPTVLYDIHEPAVAKAKDMIYKNLSFLVTKEKISADEREAIMSRLVFTSDFLLVKADLLIEAIIERADIKKDLFKKTAEQNQPDMILATNTSTIPVTQIAAGIANPGRVVGIHFFNPAHIMKLVEIISGKETHQEIATICFELMKTLGKTAIYAKDAPGFIVNRVARHYYVESLKVVEEQVADLETVDALLEASGFKMGAFKLMDLIGVDVNFSVTKSIFELFHQDGKFRPSRIQQQYVDAGLHGRKTGKGFYNYE
jgi:3-hydroxybutyryl-CoA dehydrogenase